MPHILGILIALIVSFSFRDFIRKNPKMTYIITGVVSVLLLLVGFASKGNVALESFLPSGFFIIVMYLGVFSRTHKLRPIRRQLSIIACILIAPHIFIYLLELFTNLFQMGDMYTLLSYLVGVLTVIIMIPLFITSFIKVRKKYSVQSWKKLHRLSYVAYLLIYVHIVFVGLSKSELGHVLITSIVFGVYTVLRILKYAREREI
jgi:DMSO/TMAO reductase YedYZ heme-binding membrane subunit